MAEVGEPEGAVEAEPVLDTGAVGVAVALDAAREDPLLRGEVAAFLASQRSLIELQKEQVRQRRLRTASDAVKLALQSATLAAILGALILLGVMVRDARNAHGLVVAGFSAPPAYAARGLTGEVLGNDLTSRIAAVARFTNGNSLARSDDVRGDSAEAVKLEIPQTGVSLGEVARYLRGWLGHERRLTADLRDEGGSAVSITLALAGADPVVVRGPAADIDRLMNLAGEQGFALFDPGNAIIYLFQKGRQDEAFAAAERLVRVARTPREMAGAYGYWSLVDPDRARAFAKAQIAIQMDPTLMQSWIEATTTSTQLGHDEAALAYGRRGLATRREDQERGVRVGYASAMAYGRWQTRLLTGDYVEPGPEASFGIAALSFASTAQVKALLHDAAGAERQLGFAQVAGGVPPNLAMEMRWAAAAAAGDWPTARAAAQALVQLAENVPPGIPLFFRLREARLPTSYRPWLALAEAKTGDIAGAQALAAKGPLNCYLCVRVRGQVAEAAGDRAGADRWFAEAVRQAPSLPFAHLEWGQVKLARGDRAGAVAEFSKAHALSPRFADPLEAWGEALAAGGDAGAAMVKYADADRIAPKWGRLHLKWGEALAKLGRPDHARAQFRSAAGLYLSGPDRAELTAQRT